MVAGYQAEGFRPQVEMFAKINDAYVGVDLESKRLLAYPVGQDGHLFRLDEIWSWRILPVGKGDHRLELLTRLASIAALIDLVQAQVLATYADGP